MARCPNYHSAREARIRAAIALKESILAKLYTTYSNLSEQEVHSYALDTTEGMQKATRNKIDEILSQIESIEAEIEYLYRELCSRGIVNLNLRRKIYPLIHRR
jgi:hypothetical protein